MKKNVWKKTCCWTLVLLTCIVFNACSDDDETAVASPGKITATGVTEFVSYSMRGVVRIPVTVENPEVMPEPGMFRYLNYTESGSEDLTRSQEINIFAIQSVEQGEGGGYVLIAEYNNSILTSREVTCTLAYEGTNTSIPIKLTCYDALRMITTHLGAGLSGLLKFEKNENAYVPGGIPDDLTVTQLQVLGDHAKDVSFEVDKQGTCVHITLSDNFEFTPEEEQWGYSGFILQATMSNGDVTFYLNNALHICPSSIMDTETIPADEVKHNWYVEEAAKALGMDADEAGNIILKDRPIEYYIARKGEPLVPVDEFDVSIFPGKSSHHENEETVYHPVILLSGVNNLPSGEYVFVAHVKKLTDENNSRYVDIRMPFVKE